MINLFKFIAVQRPCSEIKGNSTHFLHSQVLILLCAQFRKCELHHPFLKGKCHAMEIFFKGLIILISTFYVCANGFQGISKAFHYYYAIINLLSASLKLLTNFGNAY
jgi:hypothetical protein